MAIAFSIEPYPFPAGEAQTDTACVSAGLDHEVVFQLLLIPIVYEIDVTIDAVVARLAPGRYTGSPLFWIVANEIVDFARQFILRVRDCRPIAAEQLHSQECELRGCAA